MQITVNGQTREFTSGSSIQALLQQLGVDARKVAVERNLSIVPPSRLGAQSLEQGDIIEIVSFIGGG